MLGAGRTWGIMADAHPDSRSSKTLDGSPVFERVEQGVGHRFIWTDMANERQMRPMQPPDLRFGNGIRVIRLFGHRFWALVRLRAHPGAVAAGRHAEAATKGASERFMILETAIEGDVEQRRVMNQQPERGAFQPEPRHVVPGCLADQRLEGALEVRRRQRCLRAQRVQAQILVEMRLNVDEERRSHPGRPPSAQAPSLVRQLSPNRAKGTSVQLSVMPTSSAPSIARKMANNARAVGRDLAIQRLAA